MFKEANPFAAKKTPVQKTVTIPTSISAAKKNLEEKQKTPTTSEEVKKEAVTVVEKLGNDEFDRGDVDNALSEIIENLKSRGKSIEITALKQPFELTENSITFKLIGEIQEDAFQKIKPELLKTFRQKLNNASLTLAAEITEESEDPSVRKLYTNSDKFAYLLEKSPALKELQKRFGLETDF